MRRAAKQARDDAEWLASEDPERLPKLARDRAWRDRRMIWNRKYQLIGVAAVRRWAKHLTPRGLAALEIAERMADANVPEAERAAALLGMEDGSLDRPGGYRRAPESVYSTRQAVEAVTSAVMMLVSPTLDEIPPARASLAMIKVREAFLSYRRRTASELIAQAGLVREVLPNPFREVIFNPAWRTSTTLALAEPMYDSGDFTAMPILADALEEAGCNNATILEHCRGSTPHIRGCWVIDLVLGRE